MKDFLGIKNVVDATPILGKDGITDGFRILYKENGRTKEITKYVRAFDPNSVGNDGTLHGFGRGTIYSRSTSSKKKVAKKSVGMTKSGLSYVSKLLKK